jgi:hypothetical protein
MNKLSFSGAGHNGHTLVAAILDSHPEVSIANDYDADTEKQVRRASYDPKQWDGDPYSFRLPGQGGTKHAKILGTTGRELTFDEGVDDRYHIAILRHPMDVIGSTYRRHKNRSANPEEATFKAYEGSLCAMAAVPSYYMNHEHFVLRTEHYLTNLLEYLDLSWEPEWLDRAVSIVIPTPLLSRAYFPWTDEYIDRVQHYVDVDFRLKAYRGDVV